MTSVQGLKGDDTMMLKQCYPIKDFKWFLEIVLNL